MVRLDFQTQWMTGVNNRNQNMFPFQTGSIRLGDAPVQMYIILAIGFPFQTGSIRLSDAYVSKTPTRTQMFPFQTGSIRLSDKSMKQTDEIASCFHSKLVRLDFQT